MKKNFLILFVLLTTTALTAHAGTLFKNALSAAQEVPPVNSTATGFGSVRLNDAGTQITVNLSFTGLSSNQTAAHIHGSAPAGQNAPVLFNIGALGGTSGTFQPLTFSVTPQQVADLRAGLWYFNVHTANNPGGEIRAQITADKIVDFNGDGKTDFAVIRRPGPIGAWTLFSRNNGETNLSITQWGQSPTDLYQPVDFDGDSKDDIAVWRNTTGFFYILNSSDGTFRSVFIGGGSGSSAVSADYDGDGKTDPAVFLVPAAAQGPGQGNWCYVASLNNPSQQVTCVPWGYRYGSQSDQVDDPYPGDFDGDGRADFRVQRRTDITNTGTTPGVFLTLTATGQFSVDYFGINTDRILPGDYDGDGKTDIAISRGFNISPGQIQFFIRYTSGLPDEYIDFGRSSNFNFAQGDYDGDGKDDLALLVAADSANPAQRHFWVRPAANPNQPIVYQWGQSGDLPLAGYNNR